MLKDLKNIDVNGELLKKIIYNYRMQRELNRLTLCWTDFDLYLSSHVNNDVELQSIG